MPLTKALGLNVGALYSARTSPVLGFSASTAPRWPGGRAVGVGSLGLCLNEQAGNGDAAFLERGDDMERRVAEDERGLVRGTPHALERAFDRGAVDVGDRRDARERRSQARLGTRQE